MRNDSRRTLTVTLAVSALAVGLLAAVALFQVASESDTAVADPAAVLVRADSHVLDDAGRDAPTLVEFLDFECESCGVAYPVVEELRERYDGRLNVVLRYFPLDGHANARNAAHAVEAAARQGELESMYARMFDTQAEWGDQQVDHSALFRRYAQDLGLDMERYDADVSSDDVVSRVQRDAQDGRAMGVSGTPTFFLDGRPMQITSVQSFYDAIDRALLERESA